MIVWELDTGVHLKPDCWNHHKDLGRRGLNALLASLGALEMFLLYPIMFLPHESPLWGISMTVAFFALLVFGLAGGFGFLNLRSGDLFRHSLEYPFRRTTARERDLGLYLNQLIQRHGFESVYKEDRYIARYKVLSPDITLAMRPDGVGSVRSVIFMDHDGRNLPLLHEMKDLVSDRFGLNPAVNRV